MWCSCWGGGGEREREQLGGSRHVLEEEFREFGDWVDVWVGQLRRKEVSRMIPVFPIE